MITLKDALDRTKEGMGSSAWDWLSFAERLAVAVEYKKAVAMDDLAEAARIQADAIKKIADGLVSHGTLGHYATIVVK
jgi:hypothetical protein